MQYAWPGLAVLNELEVPYSAHVAYTPDGGRWPLVSGLRGIAVEALPPIGELQS